eukprot:9370101-Pyramimonas_sp.AAC.1
MVTPHGLDSSAGLPPSPPRGRRLGPAGPHRLARCSRFTQAQRTCRARRTRRTDVQEKCPPISSRVA